MWLADHVAWGQRVDFAVREEYEASTYMDARDSENQMVF